MKIVSLSIIQGLTEWFPISSSGHLVIFQELFKIKVSVAFDIMLHIGTLAGVILFTRKDLAAIFKALLKLDFSSNEGRLLIYLLLGTIPIAMLGLFFKEFFESLFKSLLFTGIAMLINGIILYLTKYPKPRKKLNASNALLIGIAQAFAITPGISRMGITVSTALLSGIELDEAYRFSLLLSILSIGGGSIIKIGDVDFEKELPLIILGIAVTSITGYLVLKILKRCVIRKRFYKFAYYCFIAGTMVLLLGILKL
jgi:undecaprenyl-diphosphatase